MATDIRQLPYFLEKEYWNAGKNLYRDFCIDTKLTKELYNVSSKAVYRELRQHNPAVKKQPVDDELDQAVKKAVNNCAARDGMAFPESVKDAMESVVKNAVAENISHSDYQEFGPFLVKKVVLICLSNAANEKNWGYEVTYGRNPNDFSMSVDTGSDHLIRRFIVQSSARNYDYAAVRLVLEEKQDFEIGTRCVCSACSKMMKPF